MSVDYKEIRRSIENERLLLELMTRLTPEQFDALMRASQDYVVYVPFTLPLI